MIRRRLSLILTFVAAVALIWPAHAQVNLGPPYSEYADPTASGLNQFLGQTTGNRTLSPGGGAADLASGDVAFGPQIMHSLTTGEKNVGMGVQALFAVTSGNENIAYGTSALSTLTTTHENTAIGNQALQVTTGSQNTAVGGAAGVSQTTGSFNVLVGVAAGDTATPANANLTGSNNTYVGYESGPSTATQLTNAIALGYRALVGASNATVIGNTSTTSNLIYGTPSTVKLQTPTALNPTGTASTSGVMMGLAQTMTPALSTRVFVTMSGLIGNSVGVGDTGEVVLAFGSTAAPANGDAASGTQAARTFTIKANAGQGIPFTMTAIVTVVPGTTYWFDADVLSITGGTTTISNVTVTAFEM